MPRASRPAATAALVAAAALVGAGCRALPWIDDAEPTVAPAPSPITAPEVATTAETGSGRWALETYDTDLGACVDLVGPHQLRTVQCVANSPIADGHQTRHWIASTGIDTATRQPDAPVRWLQAGIVRTEVSRILLQPSGHAAAPVDIVEAPNADARVFLALLPPGVTRYRLRAYDTDGCLLQAEDHDLAPGPPPHPDPIEAHQPPDCSQPAETVIPTATP